MESERRPAEPRASLPALLAGFVLAMPPSSGWAQAVVVHGSVRDAGRPLSGVVVQIDGGTADTTNGTGMFRVSLPASKVQTLRFARIGYLALIAAVEFTVTGGDEGDSTRLDVAWPPLPTLVARVCPEHPVRMAAVVGRVRGPVIPPDMEVVAHWESAASPPTAPEGRARRFGGLAVPVSPDGSFVLCQLPSQQTVRLSARRGLAAGPVRTLRLRLGEVREVSVAAPDYR